MRGNRRKSVSGGRRRNPSDDGLHTPGVRVQDFPSKGISYRTPGKGRAHHTLSTTEHNVLLLLKYLGVAFEEQKEISAPECQAIAQGLGIAYPSLESDGSPVVMTFDFFLPNPSPFFPESPGALQVKTSSDLCQRGKLPRMLAKFEIQRRYCLKFGYGFSIVDETLVPEHVSMTLALLQQCESLPEHLSEHPTLSKCVEGLLSSDSALRLTLREHGANLSRQGKVSAQDALFFLKHLLWTRRIYVDITQPFSLDSRLTRIRRPASASTKRAAA